MFPDVVYRPLIQSPNVLGNDHEFCNHFLLKFKTKFAPLLFAKLRASFVNLTMELPYYNIGLENEEEKYWIKKQKKLLKKKQIHSNNNYKFR